MTYIDVAPTNITDDFELPEAETVGLGYPSLTYTASNNTDNGYSVGVYEKEEIPKLSELIADCFEKHKDNPKVRAIKYQVLDFIKYAQITENYWIHTEQIGFGKCTPGGTGGESWGLTRSAHPCETRFSLSNRTRRLYQIHRIIDFEEAMGTKEFTLLSLTASHDGGWEATYKRLLDGWNKLSKILRKYVPDFRYFRVAEPHPGEGDTGYPHFHVFIAGRIDNTVKNSSGRGMEDFLRDMWAHEWELGDHTFGLDFEVVDDQTKVLNYLMKYVGKSYYSLNGWDAGELIFNTMLYACAHRKEEDNPTPYRTMSCCQKYSELVKRKNKAPQVVLEADLKPIEEMVGEDVMPVKAVVERRLLIPNFIGSPRFAFPAVVDYSTPGTRWINGVKIDVLPIHWGRLCVS